MNKGPSKKNQEKLKAALAAIKKENGTNTQSGNSKAGSNRTGTQAN